MEQKLTEFLPVARSFDPYNKAREKFVEEIKRQHENHMTDPIMVIRRKLSFLQRILSKMVSK